MESTYIDLLVSADDYSLDAGSNPLFVTDLNCIAQDIKHAIRESGLLVRMIGERDAGKRRQLMNEVEIVVEDDKRITPGTAVVTEAELGNIAVSATALDFGPFSLGVL